MPKISVVMPVYNAEKYLRQSVLSVLEQTEKDFEFIIINDGSKDSSLSILQEFKNNDSRIILVSRENKGVVASLNEAVELASSEYVARMDADDISFPTRLEEQFAYMKECNLALCGTWARAINNNGTEIKVFDYPPREEDIRSYTLRHNPFIHPTVMFRKDIFIKVGAYKPFFKHIEDYELWTRIVFSYRASNLQKVLLEYRVHDDQITKKFHTRMVIQGLLVRALALIRS